MLEEYYQEADVTIYWDTKNKWIYANWRNIPSAETVKRGCAEIMSLFEAKAATRILNNNAEVTGPWSSSSSWVAEVWFPKIIVAGLQRFAWIQSPHSALSRLSAQRSMKNDSEDVIRLFDNREEAEAWLKEEP